ncbi:hypothetical protein EDB83DRAFT_2319314 [Lactarius deliciosus]|nr:hypothetical protein EDB83DRAFT_2319314 [Lactarius deliciosus]
MASNGAPSTPSSTPSHAPSPAPTSQSHENSVQDSHVGKSGPLYQPSVYHPHVYAQYYNQSLPYRYSVQPIGMPPPHSEPFPIPTPVSSEETPVPAKRGPGRPRNLKQPTDTAARKPHATVRKGRMTGSQNWSAQDLIALAHFVEEAVPLGMNVWKRIEGQYNSDYAIPNNRQERGWDNMREKWYKIVSDGPPTGDGEMPDALNEVFRVNHMMEDIGGLVDPEDLPEVENRSGVASASGRASSGNGAGGNDEVDSNSNDADYATPAKKTFVTSRPGMDGGGSIGISGSSTTRRTRQSSASLAEKLLSSISPDAEARQNDNRAVMRLYLQQIRAQEETIRVRELQNDALRQEVANLQDKIQTMIRELSRAERRVDKFKARLELLEMMGTYRGRSSQHHRTHHKRTLSSSSSSANSSASSTGSRNSQSSSRPVLKGKRRHVDSKTSAKGKGKMVYHDVQRDHEDEEAAASLMTLADSSKN